VRFQSRYPNYKIVLEPKLKNVVDNRVIISAGKKAVFNHGVYETDNEKDIKKLTALSKMNGHFWPIDEKALEKAQAMAIEIEKVKAKFNKDIDPNTMALLDSEKPSQEQNRGTRNVDVKQGTNETPEAPKEEAPKEEAPKKEAPKKEEKAPEGK
jgi:hypothetical protein